MIELKTNKGSVLLPVKIVPGASRTRYLGEWQGRAKIAVTAPPERGKANEAVLAFVAQRLGIRVRAVSLASGASSSTKTIRIEGVRADAIRAAFEPDRS